MGTPNHPQKLRKKKEQNEKSPQFLAWKQCSNLLTFKSCQKEMPWGGGVTHGGAQMKHWILGFLGCDQSHQYRAGRFWMAFSHIILGKEHVTISRVVPAKTIFSWGAGVTHGGAQMKQISLRINMLRWDIAHRPKMVNRTWMTVNNSSYMHWHQYSWSKPEMGSWGRPWRCTNEAKTLSIHHFELLCCDSAVRW